MQLEGKKIMVTGGAGLIGSHVVDQLIAEKPGAVVLFDKDVSGFEKNRNPDIDYSRVKVIEGDLTRVDEVEKALEGVDYVVHTASMLARNAVKELRSAFDVNVVGTFNLLEAGAALGIKKVIYSSTVLVCGDNPPTHPITEEHPLKTQTAYGGFKVASEFLLRIFNNLKGLDYLILRYIGTYGPRQHFRGNLVLFIPECFDRIQRGLPPIIYGDGSQPYDYIYVDDVARANILALKSDVSGEVVNIGTGVTHTVKDVVEMIREITGTSLLPEYAPQGDRFQQESLWPDVTKAEKRLGFKARYSMKEGLTEYYRWLKANAARQG